MNTETVCSLSRLTLNACLKRCLLSILSSLLLWSGATGNAAEVAPEVVVTQVRPASGQAWRTPSGQEIRLPLVVKQTLQNQDLITTGPDTWVQLLFRPSCQVWIGPNSRVLVKNLQYGANDGQVELIFGKVRATLGSLLGLSEEHFSVTAESVFAAPRGTDFVAERATGGPLHIAVLEGLVEVGNASGERVQLQEGSHMAFALEGPLNPTPLPNLTVELVKQYKQPGLQVQLPPVSTLPQAPVLPGAAQGVLEPTANSSPLAPPVVIPPPRPWAVELNP